MHMDPDYEQQLEAAVRRELNTLSELQAPSGLDARILRAIELRASAPWYRQAWPTWSRFWQVASALGLLAVFGALCFGAWQFGQTPAFAALSGKVSEAFEWLGLVQRTSSLLLNSIGLVFARLGPGVLVAVGLVLAAACATCVGCGTIYARLTSERRQI